LESVTFITGNKDKFEIAEKIFSDYGVTLSQHKIETPEIQTLDIEEVAKYSVIYAAEKLQKPVIVTDVGHYITALGGFPGPFIKFINQTLSSEDLLNLMNGKDNREVILRECLAYCEPSKEPITFVSEIHASISNEVEGEGSSIDKVLILEGFDKPKGAYLPEVSIKYFQEHLDFYYSAAKYIGGLK